MKKISRLFDKKWASTVLWILIIIAAWEIGASIVSVTKRTPENILPHLYQVIAAAFSTRQVSAGMSATMVVLTSARATILRALLGFLLGTGAGFVLALLMKLSGLVEKMLFPYLMFNPADPGTRSCTDYPLHHRGHQQEPHHHCRHLKFLSGGNQHTGRFQIRAAGKIRSDVYLRGKEADDLCESTDSDSNPVFLHGN